MLQFDFSNLLNLFLATNLICDILEMLTQAGAKRIKCCRLVHMYLVWGSVIRVRRLNGGVSAESARGGNLPGFHSLPGTGPCPQYTHLCQDLRPPIPPHLSHCPTISRDRLSSQKERQKSPTLSFSDKGQRKTAQSFAKAFWEQSKLLSMRLDLHPRPY